MMGTSESEICGQAGRLKTQAGFAAVVLRQISFFTRKFVLFLFLILFIYFFVLFLFLLSFPTD
jgi:hypothetical protein